MSINLILQPAHRNNPYATQQLESVIVVTLNQLPPMEK